MCLFLPTSLDVGTCFWLLAHPAGLRTLKMVSVISRQEEERKVSVVLQMKTTGALQGRGSFRSPFEIVQSLRLQDVSGCIANMASKLLEKSHRKLQQSYSCSQIWHLGVKGASAHPSV